MTRIKTRHVDHLCKDCASAGIGGVDLLPVKKFKMRNRIKIKKTDGLIFRDIRFEAQDEMFTNQDRTFVYRSFY